MAESPKMSALFLFGYLVKLRGLFTFSEDIIPQNVGTLLFGNLVKLRGLFTFSEDIIPQTVGTFAFRLFG